MMRIIIDALFSAFLLLVVAGSCVVQGQDQCGSFAPPAVIRGKKFFNSITGEYVPIRGINYYPRPNTGELSQTNSIDFFTDDFRSLWEPDIARFQELNVNVLRIYAVQPGVSHDAFMCALRAANIFVIVGLAADCQNCAITRESAPTCYPPELKSRGQFIIAEFARYDNVLAFSAGNEISLFAVEQAPRVNAPCQKQFLRDMRAYINECSSTVRQIPVGLDIADVDRDDKVLWYNCRSNPDDTLENAEYIGMNAYLHCDGTATSPDGLPGFEAILADFQSYETSVPVLLSEFGCISSTFPAQDGFAAQRNFLQIDTLFSQRFREEFVGGVVFEWSTELINSNAPYPFTTYGEGNFGVGYFEPEDCDDIDILCNYIPFPQFDTLSAKYGAVDTSTEMNISEYEASFVQRTPPSCPADFPRLDSFTWGSDSVEDRECPGPVYVTCSDIPAECNSLGIPPPPPATSAPVTATSTANPAAPVPTAANTTQLPTADATQSPTANPSMGAEPSPNSTTVPTVAPVATGEPSQASVPTRGPTVAPATTTASTPPVAPSPSPAPEAATPTMTPSSSASPDAIDKEAIEGMPTAEPAETVSTLAPTKDASSGRANWRSRFSSFQLLAFFLVGAAL